MKCSICREEIPYNGGVTFIGVHKFEMAWGEQSIYPFETEKTIVCSVDCLKVLCLKIE
jgi:hypothetical protein